MHKLARVTCMSKIHTLHVQYKLYLEVNHTDVYGEALSPTVKTSTLVKKSLYYYEFENGGPDERRTCTLQIISFCRGTKTKGKHIIAARSESVSSFTKVIPHNSLVMIEGIQCCNMLIASEMHLWSEPLMKDMKRSSANIQCPRQCSTHMNTKWISRWAPKSPLKCTPKIVPKCSQET